MKIAMIGVGYVGLVSGTCFSEVGFDVACVDTDPNKIASLRLGKNPIFEPGLEAMLKRNISAGRLTFTGDMAEALVDADAVFIAVGTPEGEDGAADLKYVRAVAQQLGQSINAPIVVVVKSTVPMGTCDEVESIVQSELKKRNLDHKVTVASNPEFLKEGHAVADFMRPDRVIIGLEDKSKTEFFQTMYKPFVIDDAGKVQFMDRRSSELTKYAANCMLATRISFMNEMAILCEKVGANVDFVRKGIGADDRIGKKFLYAGPGYGGSCFPKDVSALLRLSKQYDMRLAVLEGADLANETQGKHTFSKIEKTFVDLKAKKFAVWGLSFKPETDDVRDSPSIALVKSLLKAGAEVVGHDPEGQANFARALGDQAGLSYADDAYEAADGSDGVILMTEWNQYRVPDYKALKSIMRTKAIFDFRNQYSIDDMKKHGFIYECVGRPNFDPRKAEK